MTSDDLETLAERLVSVADRLTGMADARSPGAVDPRMLATELATVARACAGLARHARAERILHG